MHWSPAASRFSFVTLLLRGCVANSYGSGWGSGPADSAYKFNHDGTFVPDPNYKEHNFIVFAQATLTLPPTASPIVGNNAIWMGMRTYYPPWECLIQGITNSYASSHDPTDVCGDLGENRWCVAAFILEHDSTPTGQKVVANTGDKVTSTYEWQEKTDSYLVTMSINGAPVSTVTSPCGRAIGVGFANECTTKPCGQVSAQVWTDFTFRLAKADKNYIKSVGEDKGVTGSIKSADGQTWTSGNISLPAYFFDTD